MKKIPNDELKVICVNILKRFNEICKEHNLRYSIYYGTLIGAVRHKGFIPWDDDVDVVMPRADYEKLMSLQYQDDVYEIKNYRYSSDYFYPFAKMIDKSTHIEEKYRAEKGMGLYIDIFPVDYVDNYPKGFEKDINNALRTRKFINHLAGSTDKKYAENIVKYAAKKLVHIFTDPIRLKVIGNFDHRYIKDSGEYCINFVNNVEGAVQLMRSEYWDNLIPMKFEGLEVIGFGDYDAILTKKYGDYMQLPPKEAQITHHSFTAYYKN